MTTTIITVCDSSSDRPMGYEASVNHREVRAVFGLLDYKISPISDGHKGRVTLKKGAFSADVEPREGAELDLQGPAEDDGESDIGIGGTLSVVTVALRLKSATDPASIGHKFQNGAWYDAMKSTFDLGVQLRDDSNGYTYYLWNIGRVFSNEKEKRDEEKRAAKVASAVAKKAKAAEKAEEKERKAAEKEAAKEEKAKKKAEEKEAKKAKEAGAKRKRTASPAPPTAEDQAMKKALAAGVIIEQQRMIIDGNGERILVDKDGKPLPDAGAERPEREADEATKKKKAPPARKATRNKKARSNDGSATPAAADTDA